MKSSRRAASPGVLVVGEAEVDPRAEDAGSFVASSPARVARALGRLDVSTRMLTYLAPDDDGMAVLYELLDSNVSVVPGSFSAERTPSIDEFAWSLPPGREVYLPEVLHVGSRSAFEGGGSQGVLDLVARAREEQRIVSFDPSLHRLRAMDPDGVRSRFEQLARHATIISVLNRDLDLIYPGEEVGERISRLVGLGAMLVAVSGPGETTELATPVFRATAPAVDQGRGDVDGVRDSFTAALLSYSFEVDLAGAKAADLARIGRLATSAAAVTASRPGYDPPWLAELGTA